MARNRRKSGFSGALPGGPRMVTREGTQRRMERVAQMLKERSMTGELHDEGFRSALPSGPRVSSFEDVQREVAAYEKHLAEEAADTKEQIDKTLKS